MSLRNTLSSATLNTQTPPEVIQKISNDIIKALRKNTYLPIVDFNKEIDENLLHNKISMLSCLVESTKTSDQPNNTFASEPINHFYFCSENALTIGYGTKIEYHNGKLCPEGVETLKKLNIKRGGISLTFEEKENLVKQCFTKRNERDRLAQKSKAPCVTNSAGKSVSASTPTRKIKPDTQALILFENEEVPVIDKANALFVAHDEMHDKFKKMKEKNAHVDDSYFSRALATDLAFQYGSNGVKSKSYYKNINNNVFPTTLNYSENRLKDDDRAALRELMCKMAYRAHTNKKARKGKLATQQEQENYCLYGLKTFTNMYKDKLMLHESHKTVLMEEFMTLTIMQSMRDGQSEELTGADIQKAKEKAHSLVYDTLFNSSAVQQVPYRIQPITIIESINKLPDTLQNNNQQIKGLLNNHLQEVAQQKITRYNEKNNTNIQFIPDNTMVSETSETETNNNTLSLQTHTQKERW